MEENKKLVCASCGADWKNEISNVCSECGGFCTWGYEKGKPMSFTIEPDGTWKPNKPTGDGFFDGMKAVHDPLANVSAEEYGRIIRESSYKIVKSNFDLDEIFNFCQEHKVEVMMQADTLIHCYIDYKEGDGSWAEEFDGFTAMVVGIKKYKEFHKKSNR